MPPEYPPQTDEDIADYNQWNAIHYRLIAESPYSWRYTAHQQLWSAQILYDAHLKSERALPSEDPAIRDAHVPGMYTLASCHLLFGLAVENLCKALAVQMGEIKLKGDQLDMPKVFRGHRLGEMVNELGIETSPEEQLTLHVMGLTLNSMARYPVATSAVTHHFTRRDDGSIATPVTLSTEQVDATKAFAKKLDMLINPAPFVFRWD